MTRNISFALFAVASTLVATGGCNHDRVNTFHVGLLQPVGNTTLSVCKNQQVEISWDVHGSAALGIAKGSPEQPPSPAQFKLEKVDSASHKDYVVTESTVFKIVATDANPAKDGSFAMQYAVVPVAPIHKGDSAKCDASNKCVSSFKLDASPSMLVRWIGGAMIQFKGHAEPVKICVTHDGAQLTCVEPNAVVNLGGVSAGGDWTLSADLPQAMQPGSGEPAPEPVLKMQFDFGCPSTL